MSSEPRDPCKVTVTHGGWTVTVDGSATNQEAEELATCVAAYLCDAGPEGTAGALRDESRQNQDGTGQNQDTGRDE